MLNAKRGQYLHSVSSSCRWCDTFVELSCLVIKCWQVKKSLQHWNQFYSASHSIPSRTARENQTKQLQLQRVGGLKTTTSWCHSVTEWIRAGTNNYFSHWFLCSFKYIKCGWKKVFVLNQFRNKKAIRILTYRRKSTIRTAIHQSIISCAQYFLQLIKKSWSV